jgi:ankyrin repeat protein
MSRDLPAQPNLEHLRKQAKDRLREWRRQDVGTRRQLSDAQHDLAREYGFATWAALKTHVESLAEAADPARALSRAIQANDAATVRRLLERSPALRATINDALTEYDAFGDTPLTAAVQRTNQPMVDALLEFGADINVKSHWWAGGFGVLDQTSVEFAPYLISRGAVVEAPAAARLGMLDVLKGLIAAHPTVVHAKGPDGQTALHDASTIEIARLLLDHGADIDALDVDHESTPAQYMLRSTNARHYPRDRQDIARELVARGCRTDLLMAAALGDLPLAGRHLDADPESVRLRVSDRYFPKRNPKSGGTIYYWTLGKNRPPHVVARDFGHEDVFQLLMERSPADLRLSIACELGDEARFQELLAQRPGLVSTLSDDERRKVADAAENNNLDAVRLMLGAGWPVDARGAQAGTPLHWAAFHGNAAMVREILRHHPTVDILGDAYNMTPLGWAAFGSENGWHRETGDYAGAVEALLQAGASSPPRMDEFVASEAVREVLDRHGS